MGIQLRVSLPDQPGTLARISRTIATSGADVLWVSVLESEGGRAIDDFGLRWPEGADHQPLLDALANERGVEVVSCRNSRRLLDERADLDLLTYLLTVPERGLETLVDMAPAALDCDWAELRAPARRLAALYPTTGPLHDEVAPDGMPVRAIAGMTDGLAWAQFPLTTLGSVLVIGRDGGPQFLRVELQHAENVVTLALRTLSAALREGATASELTACLVEPSGGRRTA
ncbi:MAG TPA: hypothetical protein VHW74_10395 [Mycobacteriales bacterium]|nr:hypothetical protein [Mycobacteriales bacterium]